MRSTAHSRRKSTNARGENCSRETCVEEKVSDTLRCTFNHLPNWNFQWKFRLGATHQKDRHVRLKPKRQSFPILQGALIFRSAARGLELSQIVHSSDTSFRYLLTRGVFLCFFLVHAGSGSCRARAADISIPLSSINDDDIKEHDRDLTFIVILSARQKQRPAHRLAIIS